MITREDAKKLLPIMKAFSEGKQIQHFNIDKWEDTDFMPFTDHPSYYRIKPEPKYRPFKKCRRVLGRDAKTSTFWMDKTYNRE